MAKIQGLEGLTDAQINEEIAKGGRFVVFEYAISILIMTFKRSSELHFIRAGESAFGKALPYILLTLFLGWWGIPWGPIYSVAALFTNLSGGRNVTDQVLRRT